MAVTKSSFSGEDGPEPVQFNTSPDHPDEVVVPAEEIPSQGIAEAKVRHEHADTDLATPQERKQAAVEQAHALATRPDGSYAQLHETERPTLAVADEAAVSDLREERADAVEQLKGAEPASSPAGVRREEASASARQAAAEAAAKDAGGKDSAAK